jgi:hypothetical protein
MAADDVKAGQGREDGDHQGKGGQADVVGHRYRHGKSQHADEMHRPYSAAQGDRCGGEPDPARSPARAAYPPAKIECRIRRKAGAQNGQSDEIRIIMFR